MNTHRFSPGLTISSALFAGIVCSVGVLRSQENTEGFKDLSATDWAAIRAARTQIQYIKASNTGGYSGRYTTGYSGDQFGSSVAMAGDTVVIGAPGESSNASGVNGNQANNDWEGAGAAYVFVKSGGVWKQQAYLKASNSHSNAFFGGSVAISGDSIIVGARNADTSTGGKPGPSSNPTRSGAAYVFSRRNGTWKQQACLFPAAFDWPTIEFGASVAISGNTIVVGAPQDSSNATGVNGNPMDSSEWSSGAAYVFVKSGGVWKQQAYLKSSQPDHYDRFGNSVGVSGNTVVIGGNNCDSAHVFKRATGGWRLEQRLEPPDLVSGFGSSVSIYAHRLVVGAPGRKGVAYIFKRNWGGWSADGRIEASNPGVDDNFGTSVSIHETSIIVGAPGEQSKARGLNGNQSNDAADRSGAAYLFRRDGDQWIQSAYIKASNTGEGDEFGGSVAISGGDILIAAGGEDSNARGVNGNQLNNKAYNSGAAYLLGLPFRLSGESVAERKDAGASNMLVASGKKSFGTAVAGENGVTRMITVRNGGESEVTSFSVTTGGPDAGDFIIRKPVVESLAPGAATTLKVTFKPTNTGTRRASIRISGSGAGGSPTEIKLTGLGAAR